tara:strand:- start:317 stop:625 length:309 start_codon:yes stop_codon:yes gene_type:complete
MRPNGEEEDITQEILVTDGHQVMLLMQHLDQHLRVVMVVMDIMLEAVEAVAVQVAVAVLLPVVIVDLVVVLVVVTEVQGRRDLDMINQQVAVLPLSQMEQLV